MSREITNTQRSAIDAPEVFVAMLAELEFRSGTVRVTDLPHNVVVGGETWTGLGQLVSIKEVTESGMLEANGLELVLSGVQSQVVTIAMEEHVQGLPARVYLAIFDADGQAIGPPVEEWAGRIDQLKIDDSGESSTVSITVESRIADFQRSYARRFTNEDQNFFHPGDRFFEHVQQVTDMEIIWPNRKWFVKNA